MFKAIGRLYGRFWDRLEKNAPQIRISDEAMDAAWQNATEKVLGVRHPWPKPPVGACDSKVGPGYCGRPRLQGSDQCIWHHRSSDKYDPAVVSAYFGEQMTFTDAIQREVKSGASLEGAYLVDAKLGGSGYTRGVCLDGANLVEADLRRARLSYGSLRSANLVFANLEEAYLSEVDLAGARVGGARLFDAKFRNNDLSGVVGLEMENFRNRDRPLICERRILETYPDQAEPMYRALTTYFASRGLLDDASWAAYRSRVMRHASLKARLNFFLIAFENCWDVHEREKLTVRRIVERGVIRWLANLMRIASSWLNRWTTGYGEKPARVVLTSVLVVVLYAVAYKLAGALGDAGITDALYFSIAMFTTVGTSSPTADPAFRFLAISESVVGLILVGQFLFTLSRRAVGRA